MSLTRHDVENIAHLARLALSEEQLPVYVDSLSKIFSFVEQLNGADIATVEPIHTGAAPRSGYPAYRAVRYRRREGEQRCRSHRTAASARYSASIRPRGPSSSSLMISMARTLGAPVTVPAGKPAISASSALLSGRIRPSTFDTMCMTWL